MNSKMIEAHETYLTEGEITQFVLRAELTIMYNPNGLGRLEVESHLLQLERAEDEFTRMGRVSLGIDQINNSDRNNPRRN